ncbi:MAG: hypothetical protein JSW39_06370, partial [Desulfobacterales bacterium]
FMDTIRQAYQDGVRIFLEIGPQSSCTRMINRILEHRPHRALAACVRGEADYITTTKVLAGLIAERVPVDLDQLYGKDAYPAQLVDWTSEASDQQLRILIGGQAIAPVALASEPGRRKIAHRRPQTANRKQKTAEEKQKTQGERQGAGRRLQHSVLKTAAQQPANRNPFADLIDGHEASVEATSKTHQTFLNFSRELTQSYGATFSLQTKLLELAIRPGETRTSPFKIPDSQCDFPIGPSTPAFSRDMCLEFATGSVAKVLGPEFAVVDTYKTRVRLPDEPLMLVDRILTVEGLKGSLGAGRVVTEHDVLPNAWYLDGGHAPVCIVVEAGQADLFLCAYLGIDLAVKGARTYRLLDATVEFHRGLPRPGDTIRYEIAIEKFVRQDHTYLFFFSFEGYIDDTLLISMTNGCAGFFTPAEIRNSGGIIMPAEDTRPVKGQTSTDWSELVAVQLESYDAEALTALRSGDLAGCFGSQFEGIRLSDSLRLPDGRMHLIDRVVKLDPNGGRYGLGLIQAAADIHPDAWFLTCHFMVDMVMPGTLMYECCAHTLRIFLQRRGWVTDKPGVRYEPMTGVKSILKCRGPVTPETRLVLYEVEVKEIGYAPQPYAIADAHMYVDGHRIVLFKDLAVQMTGITRAEIEALWEKQGKQEAASDRMSSKPPIFDRRHFLEFARGRPSKAFGAPYNIFDEHRFIARLPGPPYLFMDRVTHVEPPPWVLKPDGWIAVEYEVPADAWYFRADRTPAVPLSVMLEIALQPCGWLAAYMGSALRSPQDLRFRNLGGEATLHHEVRPDSAILTVRTRLTQASEAGDMIIEHFAFEVSSRDKMMYSGQTYFGFFTSEALARQEGLRGAARLTYRPSADELNASLAYVFQDEAPHRPEDPESDPAPAMALPAKALRMIDRIEAYAPQGGPAGLGFIRGIKTVDPREWFFAAHFYQDPVCPGSLGIESFVQLLKFMARERWPHLVDSHRFGLLTGKAHCWTYRGQITPRNQEVTVEAVVQRVEEFPSPTLMANGFLQVDGLNIYKMEDFGVKLIPV